jgi:hypothetical protein
MPDDEGGAEFLNADPDTVARGRRLAKCGAGLLCAGIASAGGVFAYVGGGLGEVVIGASLSVLLLAACAAAGYSMYSRGVYLVHGHVSPLVGDNAKKQNTGQHKSSKQMHFV